MAKSKPPKTTRPRRPSLTTLQPFVDRSSGPDELATRLSKQARPDAVDEPDEPKASDADANSEDNVTARRRFAAALEANGPWAASAAQDVKWCAGMDGDTSYQWPQGVQQARDLAQRPFETINRLPSFIKQVTNQQRQAGPAMQVVPLKGRASEDAAEVREGLLRHTMLVSDGEVQVDTAFEDMAIQGKGYVEVVSRYEDEGDEDSADQEIYVEWRDPFTVFIDPAAVKLDKSDMKYAFIPYDLPTADYNTLYPDSEVAKNGTLAWQGLDAQDKSRWFPDGCVRVAKYYEITEELVDVPGSLRRLKRSHVTLRIINALETLETVELKRGKYALKRIPIVPMLGDRYVIDGKEDYRGMVRLARGPQRMLNFWITTLTEQIQLSISAPWLVGWSQIEGFEDIWKNQNTSKPAFLPWKDTLKDGRPGNTTPPQRIVQEPAIGATVTAINIADQALQQVMQLYDPSLGKGKNDQSGKAIETLQQQGEIGNSNYIDNLKRFYRSLGRLLLQMYPVYYDTARMRRIIGKDGQSMSVMVHAGADNAPDDAMMSAQDEEVGIESVYDLGVGQFDIVVGTGPNFLSRRQEANANMIQMWKVAPQTLPMFLPAFLENSDWPAAREMAEIARQTISAQFQKQDPNSVEQQLAQAKQLVQQFSQQHDLIMKELQAKTDYIKTEQAKYGAQVEIKKAELASQETLQAMKNAASISVAEINAQTKGVISANELAHEQQALGAAQAHEAAMSDIQRGHEVATAHATAAGDAAQSAKEHQQNLELGAQPPPADPNTYPVNGSGAPV